MEIAELATPEDRRRQDARVEAGRPLPAAGTQEMDKVSSLDTAGGLQWYFYNVRQSQKESFPMEPAAQVKWAAWDSSKYCYAILKIFECVVAGDRLLIYVQNPITSQILNALLVVCGIRSLHYMSRNSQGERDTAVEHFNYDSSPYSVLITSMQLASFGVNFHKACHHGLIMESVSNLSTEVQATGRTWRIGQMYKVVWKRLLCADYYDCERRVWVRASILPDNQDLAIICQEPGIDVRSLRVNPYDPKMVAKPPQVPDVYRIAQLLQGPIHFAMLLNECGTDKTFTAALAMSFVIQDKIAAAERTLHPSQRASGSSNLRSCSYPQIGS